MVQTGLARVLSGEARALDGLRVGLLVNPTAVDADLVHIVDRLVGSRRCEVRCLLGPEHGIRGDAQDMISVDSGVDEVTGLPVHSLYGHDEASLEPDGAALQGLDAVVYDIQDVGSRYYTFVWTLLHVMRACGPRAVKVIVLDRPNPIGGVDVEGGSIDAGYLSFVGRLSVPNRHGLTAGEVGRLIRARGVDCEIDVVTMAGWRRDMHFDDTGLPWVLPSPNMPRVSTALVYPGMCLVEGTELSEGRGTTLPFEQVGAPWVSFAMARELAAALGAESLPGVRFRPLVFTPTFHKHAHEACGGVQLLVTDPREFRPYLTGVAVIRAFHRLDPGQFAWRTSAYEFVGDVPAFDLLTGGAKVRELIEAGAELGDIRATWTTAEAAFRDEREAIVLYR